MTHIDRKKNDESSSHNCTRCGQLLPLWDRDAAKQEFPAPAEQVPTVSSENLETILRWLQKDVSEIKRRTDQVIKEFSKSEKQWSQLFKRQTMQINTLEGSIQKIFCSCQDGIINPTCITHRDKPLPYDYCPSKKKENK